MITREVQNSIEGSVLCWLATVDADGNPNVSPKEAFLFDGKEKILIANIASPISVRNIQATGKACVSFVDVFVQKGFKIQCTARVLQHGEDSYSEHYDQLHAYIGPKFKILSVIELTPLKVSRIIAPSYLMFEKTTEKEMIQESLRSYRVKHLSEDI